jgi:hypothetical protein
MITKVWQFEAPKLFCGQPLCVFIEYRNITRRKSQWTKTPRKVNRFPKGSDGGKYFSSSSAGEKIKRFIQIDWRQAFEIK